MLSHKRVWPALLNHLLGAASNDVGTLDWQQVFGRRLNRHVGRFFARFRKILQLFPDGARFFILPA